MRKTQEEVKEELRRRRDKYEAHRKARNQRLLGGGVAFMLCLAVVLLVGRLPFSTPDLIENSGVRSEQGTVSTPSTDGDESIPGDASVGGDTAAPSADPSGSAGDESIPRDMSVGGDTAAPSTDPSESVGDESRSPGPVVYPTGFDLMANIHAMEVGAREPDNAFVHAHMQFAVNLLQQTLKEEGEKGALVSPLSAQLALAMIANGANGETLEQMEAVLGGGMSLSRLNEYLHSYTASLPTSKGVKLQLANSIWFPENGDHPREDFLQTNANYYGAGAYQAPSDQLCDLINDWVKTHTDGKIEKLFDEPSDDISAALVNTILFNGAWKEKYTEQSLIERSFTAYTGKNRRVTMLHSTEYVFLQDSDGTVGFLKPYEDARYAFVALLPEEGADILDYVASLTADRLNRILQSRQTEKVDVCLPKFTFSGDYRLNETLKAMGMPLAFDPKKADFARVFNDGGVYLDVFKQKTMIEVSEAGTVAAGASGGIMAPGTSDFDPKTVYLDRPFVYMILDTETNLPLFLGVLTDIQ